jgi:hypothetical protein
VDDADHAWTDGHARQFGWHGRVGVRRERAPDLPADFELPFGYAVTVTRVDPFDSWGEWEVEVQEMTIDRTLTRPESLEIFLHEIEHAFTDWKRWVRMRYPCKQPDPPANEPEDGGAEA